MGSIAVSRLLADGSYAGGLYVGDVLFTVLVGCVADDYRRADAHRILALLLFRTVEPDTLQRLPRACWRRVKSAPAEERARVEAEKDAP